MSTLLHAVRLNCFQPGQNCECVWLTKSLGFSCLLALNPRIQSFFKLRSFALSTIDIAKGQNSPIYLLLVYI